MKAALWVIGAVFVVFVGIPLAQSESPFGDFMANAIPQRTTFVSRVQQVEHFTWNGSVSEAAGLDTTRESVRVLYFKGRTEADSGCWIGNEAAPHNWAVAPRAVCR